MVTKNKASYKTIEIALKNLPIGIHKLKDIVDKIKSISSQKHTTQIATASQSYDNAYIEKCARYGGELIKLEDVKVDIHYQRSLKLNKIFSHLKTNDIFSGENVGFDTMLAGSVDFAVRPNGDIFVWDGFRRCILAMLKNLPSIPANVETHPLEWVGKHADKCVQKEAFCFTQRNGSAESMKPEELFKSGVAEQNNFYVSIKNNLYQCELDVMDVVEPSYTNLSGYKEFENCCKEQPFNDSNFSEDTIDYLIQSSRIIRDSVKNHDISGILLTGYACFLYKNACAENNGSDDYISEEDLEIGFTNYINTGGTQSSLTKDRLHSSSRESVAWKIATKVYGMKKSTASDMMNLTDEVSDVLGASV